MYWSIYAIGREQVHPADFLGSKIVVSMSLSLGVGIIRIDRWGVSLFPEWIRRFQTNPDTIPTLFLRTTTASTSTTMATDSSRPAELFYFVLPAPSIGQSKVFYRTVFGWEADGGSLGGHIDNTNTPCGLGPSSPVTDRQVYFTTVSLERSIELVQESGGLVKNQSVFPSVGNSAACVDDQGTEFSLLEPFAELAEHARNPKEGTQHGDLFDFSLPVMDEAKAKGFYSRVLGWTFGMKGFGGRKPATNINGPQGGLFVGKQGHRPSFWIRVDNLDGAIDNVKKAGGSTTCSRFEAHEGMVVECIDDQGVAFGMIEPNYGY